MQFKYSIKDKALFYLRYFFLKVFSIWFEVKRPKLKMFLYEMLYSAWKLMDYKSQKPSPFKTDMVETVFGRFRIRPYTVDMANVSPAFERMDVDFLLTSIGRLVKENKKILFIDIGADLGTFSVTVGNRHRDYSALSLMAVEPADSSFGILEENIRLNGLEDKATLHHLALYSEDGLELDFSFNPTAPGTSGLSAGGEGTVKVMTKTLDTLLSDKIGSYDALVLKMDVEGAESAILRGAQKTLKSIKETYLMVEDFVNPEVIKNLEEMGARFITKLTPYNSFWVFQSPKNRG
jgi:FkbM family methyltransferase